MSIKFWVLWEILNRSDPILVIELHTGSKSNFSVFFCWFLKILWVFLITKNISYDQVIVIIFLRFVDFGWVNGFSGT